MKDNFDSLVGTGTDNVTFIFCFIPLYVYVFQLENKSCSQKITDWKIQNIFLLNCHNTEASTINILLCDSSGFIFFCMFCM